MSRAGQALDSNGFTLLELLVVIAIVTLLLAILLPALGKARAAAKQAQCLSNQRQLATATYLYLMDHRHRFPQPVQNSDMDPVASGRALWFNALDPYVQQSARGYHHFVAEERNYNPFKQDPAWDAFPADVRDEHRTIKMNVFFGKHAASYPGESNARWTHDHDLRRPAETVLYFDGRALDTPSVTTGNTDGSAFGEAEIYVGLRHDDGANVAFADGHVRHHRDEIRESAGGYRGWYAGTPQTNGFPGMGVTHGPHDLLWRVGRY